MSELLDEILNYRASKPECSVGVLLRTMPKEEADAVRSAFAHPDALGSGIAAALKNHGYRISDHSVTRHKRRACACGDDVR